MSKINYFKKIIMHDDVAADPRWVLMCHVLIGYWCVILACVENYIKWFLVGHLYIVRDDSFGLIIGSTWVPMWSKGTTCPMHILTTGLYILPPFHFSCRHSSTQKVFFCHRGSCWNIVSICYRHYPYARSADAAPPHPASSPPPHPPGGVRKCVVL
jgi:hypothetical protein